MTTISGGEGLFPLRHVILYKWFFGEAATLAEVSQRPVRNHFYTVKPRDDIFVATSLTKPAAVIFTVVQTEEEGGDLILVQTPIGHYTHDQIAKAMHVFAKIAGIKITRS